MPKIIITEKTLSMEPHEIDQWSGRARTEDDRQYDLRTQSERDAQLPKTIITETTLPVALHEINQWSGRARTEDNRLYDLRTQSDRPNGDD